MVKNDDVIRVDFRHQVDVIAAEIRDLCFKYPGDIEEPGYCLLSHASDLLNLINELHLV